MQKSDKDLFRDKYSCYIFEYFNTTLILKWTACAYSVVNSDLNQRGDVPNTNQTTKKRATE